MTDLVDVLQDPAVLVEEAGIGEEVALDPRESDGEVFFVELRRARLGPSKRDGVAFPLAPGGGGFQLHLAVGRHQTAVIGGHQVAAFVLGDRGQEPLPGVRKQHRGAFLVEPVQLPLGQQEDAAQDQTVDTVGMLDGVGQRQGRTPGAAEHGPLLDAEVLAQALDVLDQAPGGVVLQTGVRARTSAAALVEQRHAPLRRIEEAPHGRIDRPARTAVQDYAGLAAWVAAFFVVDFVRPARLHPAERERLDLAEEATAANGTHGGGGSITIHEPEPRARSEKWEPVFGANARLNKHLEPVAFPRKCYGLWRVSSPPVNGR